MRCPRCATTLPDDARFCVACGTQLAGGRPEAPQPAGQPPGPFSAPSQAQWLPASPIPPLPSPPPRGPDAPGSKTGLIIGIAAGVLIALLVFGGIGAFVTYRAMKPESSSELSEATVGDGSTTTAGSSATGGSSTSVEPPATTAPLPTDPEPPTTATPQPTSPPPTPKPQVSLTEASAIDLVGNYLDDAKLGNSSKADAVTTSRYRSRKTPDYYQLAASDLEQFEVVNAQTGQGGYLVFVKEQWSSGTWTNWYLVVKKNGALVIDDTGTE